MIELYSGTPGSGKSLHIAKDIYEFLWFNHGKLVIANFDIDRKLVKNSNRFIYLRNDQLSPDLLELIAIDWWRDHDLREDGIVFIVDECQLLFNTRDWNSIDRRPWLSFFSQHRKLGYYCILVAQYDEMIDKQIRALLEYECIHRKITNDGILGFMLKILTVGDWFANIRVWYPLKKQVDISFHRARKKYYRLYDTFNTFDTV